VPVKQTKGTRLTDDQKTYNKLLCGARGIGERANALLIVPFKALRRVSRPVFGMAGLQNTATASTPLAAKG
jgi:hypothetical protein